MPCISLGTVGRCQSPGCIKADSVPFHPTSQSRTGKYTFRRSAGRPYFWQAGMQLSNIGEAYLPLKIEYAVSAGWEQGAHRVMCTGGIAHQELAYGFCTLGSAGVEYSFRKKIFSFCLY